MPHKLMFEAYINGLRLLRRKAVDLDPAAFNNLETIRDQSLALAPYAGWSLWIAGTANERVALVWPWGIIQHGIPAIDPLQIQTNLLLLDDSGCPLPEYQSFAALVHTVNRLEWHGLARTACGLP